MSNKDFQKFIDARGYETPSYWDFPIQVGNKIAGNDLIHIINMYPENPKESKYHTLIMEVNESKKTISKASIKTKDGVTIKIYVDSLINNPVIKSDQFNWNAIKYSDVDVIDNR